MGSAGSQDAEVEDVVSEPIDLVFTVDANFSMQLAVAIAGLARHAADRPHRVFVLQSGYDAGLRNKVEAVTGDCVHLHWLELSIESPATFFHRDHPWSPATLYRLRIEEQLPSEVKQVIYLDADIIVRASLGELWRTDLGETKGGAVRDAIAPWSSSVLDWRALDIPPERPYFNAGVVVIPLGRWREERISERALCFLQHNNLRCVDQCALNLALDGDWTPLDPRWNLQTDHFAGDRCWGWIVEQRATFERALADPAVVHFTNSHGWRKPWETWPSHPYTEEWFELLDSTPWAGWRPDSRRPSRFSRALGRAKRTSKVLLQGRY
jgi:lipopolysaccharide biosynthesis glycosyltransferase